MIRNTSNSRILQNIWRNTNLQQNVKCLSTAAQPEPEAKCPHDGKPIGWNEAKPYDQIPAPKSIPGLGIFHKFLPGGMYHGKTISEFQQMFHEEFGEISRMPGAMGRRDILNIFDPEDIEMVFRNEGQWPFRRGLDSFDYFRKTMKPEVFKGIGGLLTEQGQTWQDIRTKVNPIMMQPKNVRNYLTPVDSVAIDFINHIRKLRDGNNEVPSSFGNEMNKWAMESVACIAFNKRMGILEDNNPDSDAQKFIHSVHDFFELSYQMDILPSIWRMYKTPAFKKLMVNLDTMTELTLKYIDEAVEKIKKDKLTNTETDQDKSVLEKLYEIDRHVAMVMALDMMMAGIDTTSGASLSFLYMMAKYPDKQEKLREEIFEKLPTVDSKLTPELMKNMPYLRACFKETMRVKSVVPGNMRVTSKDMVIKGYRIPKGTDISFAHAYLTKLDKNFESADKFLPERWLTSHTEHGIDSAKKTHPFVYLPFGFGPRTCIGKRFAELEIEVMVLRLLRNFKVEWHYGEVKYGKHILNIPAGDLKFRFIDLEK